MSLPNLDAISALSSGFWEIGNYKANVQRIQQGSEQLDDLSRFIRERIAIENSYTKHLLRWHEQWAAYAEKHLNEGCVKKSFKFLLEEGQQMADVHRTIGERFVDEVLKTIELYKKENYHRTAFRGFKEVKEVEDEFEKAQKQWKKLMEKVELAKRNYHTQARAEKSAYIQFMNSKADPSIADYASEKSKEKFEKCKDDLKKTKENYRKLVGEITAYKGIYMENMAFVFEKCQRMEMKRLRFVIEMLSGMQKILVDLLDPPKLAQIHSKLRQHFVSTTDAAIGEDLKKWSILHGVDNSNAQWPQFEEYSGEFRHIHASSTKARNQRADTGGVVLTKKVFKVEENQNQLSRSRDDQGEEDGPREIGPIEEGNGKRGNLNTREREQPAEGEEGAEGFGRFRKQHSNSNGSQQSKATSKSSRSQSEKPHRLVNPPQQRHSKYEESLGTGSSNTAMGPLDASKHSSVTSASMDPLRDSFPMVTPLKNSVKQKENAGDEGERQWREEEEGEEEHLHRGQNWHQNHRTVNGNGRQMSAENQKKERQSKTASTEDSEGKGVSGDDPDGQAHTDLEQLPPPLPVGPAKVIYEYQPAEPDEIGLAVGEVLNVLSGPDTLGWCLGVKKNKERGLFPAGYVLPLANHRPLLSGMPH